MSINKDTAQDIKDYILKNPKYLNGYYQEVADLFGGSYEKVRHIARNIRENKTFKPTTEFALPTSIEPNYKLSIQGEDIEFTINELREFKNSKKGVKTSQEKEKYTGEGIHILSGCWHVPFQNKEMQKGLINLIKDLGDKVVGFHLLGDTLDLVSLSKHSPNEVGIPGMTLGKEYNEGNKFLNEFLEVLPEDIELTYLWGNHEDRYFRHLKNIDNSKFADALPSPTEALSLKLRGFKVYENWKEDYHQLGKLQLIHGEFCSKNPARSHIDKMKNSVAFVHTHRVDLCFDGERAGFNIGWGGNSEAPAFNYVSRLVKMNWINGFAICHIDKEQNYYMQVIPVYRNTFFYNGKKYGQQ